MMPQRIKAQNQTEDLLNQQGCSSSSSDISSSENLSSLSNSPPCPKKPRYNLSYRRSVNQNLPETKNQLNFLASVVFSKKEPLNENALINDKDFLSKSTAKKSLGLGTPKTFVAEKRVINLVNPARLATIFNLQPFGLSEWKEVSYSSVLKGCLASPRFTDIKMYNMYYITLKRKMTMPFQQNVFSLGYLTSFQKKKEILKSNLQNVIDEAFFNPSQLNPDYLYNKFFILFGPYSQISKNFGLILQIICGKRSECTETRRAEILSELPNKSVQHAF